MTDLKNRRPLSSRDTALAARITRALARRGVTPNQISMASMVAALLAGACFWMGGQTADAYVAGALLIFAAVFCQLRLLCNLFDGMVAVEAGKGAADGPFWNEFPDRISDILIFAGVGLGVGDPALGWAVAALALLVAYTRELGVNVGLAPDFSGPMAKQHRMALLTLAAVVALVEPYWGERGTVLTWALWISIIGTVLTVLRRAWRIRAGLLG